MVKVDGGGLSATSHYSCLFGVRPCWLLIFQSSLSDTGAGYLYLGQPLSSDGGWGIDPGRVCL